MSNNKKKILVHTCCAPCASYVFSELEKNNFIPVAYFYNPEIHGRAEYNKRLESLKELCLERGISLIIPEYNVQDFLSMLVPYHDKDSIKYINDKNRYQRKRCQLCISLLLTNLLDQAKKMRLKNFTTTLLCSPYRDHNEIWDKGLELATNENLSFYYQDFRKGYWTGRNYARSHNLVIPTYCGCSESLEEGRLE